MLCLKDEAKTTTTSNRPNAQSRETAGKWKMCQLSGRKRTDGYLDEEQEELFVAAQRALFDPCPQTLGFSFFASLLVYRSMNRDTVSADLAEGGLILNRTVLHVLYEGHCRIYSLQI
nr:hypothetical protein PHYPA_012155 [Physcomitrium patens]